MISLRFDKLAAITGGTLSNTEEASKMFAGVAIDSRSKCDGKLFVAIRGPQNDGHNYISSAIDKGASGIVAEFNFPNLERIPMDVPVVKVHNSHEAMLTMASYYRDRSRARFVAITGSNGKTTSRELTYQLLSAVEPYSYRSPGNLNNLYGVPLAIFGMPSDTKVAVLELGISTKSEMPRLAEIVRPQMVVITNVAPSHIEFLSSVEDVAQAKLQLVSAADDSVPVIINADDAVLVRETHKIRDNVITFGMEMKSDFQPDKVTTQESGETFVVIEGNQFRLSLVGRHQVYNLLAAYTVCRTLGYSFNNIDTENILLATEPMRGQRVKYKGIDFVIDCYNANPVSMYAGIEAFFTLQTSHRRVLILGDMLELGTEAVRYHRETGRMISNYDFDLAITVGPLAKFIAQEAKANGVTSDRLLYFNSAAECETEIEKLLQSDDLVYLKASRGIGLEAVLNPFSREEND